ncbi:MAG TPA: efflux transporter periplasmic adaptor subunit [Lentisphaeria bacterium]|nr:MAG: hypothetical protein A2X47_10995 [Lentisphaerae bacterium GWF2_38_69]HBM17315.1 efflux transporter periplasmic adaptor subunit [Lentisphaeria bacterium]
MRLLVVGAMLVISAANLSASEDMNTMIMNSSVLPDTSRQSDSHSGDKSKHQIWTCSMHPQIRSDKPGRCPICGMKLIPVQNTDEDSGSASNTQLILSSSALKLAEIETAPVVRKAALAEINLVGKINFNETRNVTISAKIPGRIEKLYLNYVGAPLKKGEHIAEIFSPELAVLQRELLLTRQSADDKDSTSKMLPDSQAAYEAALNRAKLWGLTDQQIKDILKSGKISRTLTLYSPVYGIVKEQKVLENQYFKEGDVLFVISDLTSLWLILDAYEQDLPYLHYGQNVEFKVEAFPGKVFYGMIAYINPMVDESTRTVQIRVIVNNKDGELKPGMFAHSTVFAHMGADGKALPENLEGKWICPMHPEIIDNAPGKCPICGMTLETAEKLGLTLSPEQQKMSLPLLVPETAPLITGKRSIVYVEMKPGTFEGREVSLGPKVGKYYIVEKGLSVGEKIVVKGNFKLDSELQIQAKPSMMNDSSENLAAPISHQH